MLQLSEHSAAKLRSTLKTGGVKPVRLRHVSFTSLLQILYVGHEYNFYHIQKM